MKKFLKRKVMDSSVPVPSVAQLLKFPIYPGPSGTQHLKFTRFPVPGGTQDFEILMGTAHDPCSYQLRPENQTDD